jgi:hypothetical protein
MPDRDQPLGLEHASDLEGAPSPPLAGRVQAPRAVHPEVGVDGNRAVRAHEKMLASRHDLADGLAGEIGRREAGNPEVGSREEPSRERLMQPGGGRENGVAFCHADIIR